MAAQLGTVDENGFIWTVARTNFVRLYVATGDAAVAARDSKLPKDDDPLALLDHESVKNAVASLHDQVLRRIHETADTVIARYSNVAEGNIVDYLHITGQPMHNGAIHPGDIELKDWRTMPRHMQQRIKKLKVTSKGTQDGVQHDFEIELHDSMRANDALVRVLKLDQFDDSLTPDAFVDALKDFAKEMGQLDEHYIEPTEEND